MNDNLEPLPSSTTALEQRLNAAIVRERRKNAISLVVLVLAIVVVTGYFTAACIWASRFTPDDAAAIAHQQVRSYLPQAETQLRTELQRSAPELVGAAERLVLAAPTQGADYLRTQMKSWLDANLPEVEDQLVQNLHLALTEAKLRIATADAHASDEALFRTALGVVARDVGKEADRNFDEVSAVYQTHSEDIFKYLTTLAEDRNLSPRQQLHRELLRNSMLLLHHYNQSPAPETSTLASEPF